MTSSRRHDQLSSSVPRGVDTKIARRSVEPRGLHDNPSAETYAVGGSNWWIVPLHCSNFRCTQHSTARTHPANIHYIRLSVRRASGGAEGIRTPDLRLAKAALSQLSYGPARRRVGQPGIEPGTSV